MRYETWYVIVAGVAWIRHTLAVPRDGEPQRVRWVVLFDGTPHVRRHTIESAFQLDERGTAGELDDLSWNLSFEQLAPPFRSPHALLRAAASSHIVTWPALAISGHIGERELHRAPGHAAHHWGRRHAQSWGWAHATLSDGRWAHILSAKLAGLPRLSQHGRTGRPPGLPFARGRVEPPALEVGPYTVDAEVTSFVGLRYTDTDGSTFYCYHSEAGRLRGPGIETNDAAFEIAVREELPGWPATQ